MPDRRNPRLHLPASIDGRPNKEAPVKADDHACDGMRYFVAWLDGLGKADVYIGGSMVDEASQERTPDVWNDYDDEEPRW